MIEYLDQIDKQVLLYLNGMHAPFLDTFMWYVSKTATWSLMLLALIIMLFRKNWRQALFVIVAITLTITLADQISSGIIKNLVERFRPTHSPEIGSLVHLVNGYKGGLYGFVSSHAANTIGVALFISLLFKRRYLTITLFFWATLVSYSRIYLGVHYLGDILGGICVGLLSGAIVYHLYLYAIQLKEINKKYGFIAFSEKNAKIMTCAIWCNLLITVGVSAILCFVA